MIGGFDFASLRLHADGPRREPPPGLRSAASWSGRASHGGLSVEAISAASIRHPQASRLGRAPGAGDTYERAADRAAEQVVGGGGVAPPGPANGGGLGHGNVGPLPGPTRARMESAFGADFSGVRIHADAHAARLSSDFEAQALTHGADIYFGAGQFDPGSTGGQRLLAHELTHVLQQRSTGASAFVQRKPTKKPKKKFYQPVIDKLATYAKAEYFSTVDALTSLLALCRAVDEQDVGAIPELLDIFIGRGSSYAADVRGLDPEVFHQLIWRTLELGLFDASKQLSTAYSRMLRFDDETLDAKELTIVAALVNDTTRLRPKSPRDLRAALEAIVQVFVLLRDAMVRTTPETIAYEKLQKQLVVLTGSLETSFQALLDHAADALGRGDRPGGKQTLALAREALELWRTALYSDARHRSIDDERMTITRTVIAKGKRGAGKLLDVFPGKKAHERDLPVFGYDPRADSVPEMTLSLGGLFAARRQQIETMARIYDVDPHRNPFSDDARNADLIKQIGGLRLDSDDDWRKFVLAKFESMKDEPRLGGSRTAAMDAIMDLLFAYLKAFTQHAHHVNVYDFGLTSYFNRPFPRALSGRLLHDCGVYALRVAYILSLVRQPLGLRLRYVSLPLHIALVIEGDGLPTYIVQNNDYQRISPKQLEDLRGDWNDEAAGVPPGEADAQFLGELVSHDYIAGPLDTPFVTDEVVAPTGDAKKDQRALWQQYQKVNKEPLFGKSASDRRAPNYLFDVEYLGITGEERDVYNDSILPYWNVAAPAVWMKFQHQLQGIDPKDIGSGKRPPVARETVRAGEALELVRQLEKDNDKSGKSMVDGLSAVEQHKVQLSYRLHDDPGLQAPRTKISLGKRISKIFPKDEIVLFRERIKDMIQLLEGAAPDDPRKVSTILVLLRPPFLALDRDGLPVEPMRTYPKAPLE
jgi:hypothetical protein